ncbi:MAG: hypothetical protein IJ197_05115 [Bacteroidaceae bacterium]|nr:hypothetical protein [Bacteroidaceae bacterium]
MSTDQHYNPAIYQRLQTLAALRDWQGIFLYIKSLSNAQFRTAGYIVGERIVPRLEEADVWALASELTAQNAKAFLVTMMKAIALRLQNGTMHLRSNGSRTFFSLVQAVEEDKKKVIATLVPIIKEPDDISWLLRKLSVEEGRSRISYLISIPTLAASYTLFRTLHYVEHDTPLLMRTALYLIRRGDALGFNLASLLKTYYGLDALNGTFSLRIQPYQLARLNADYQAFCHAMNL